jgi:hypothetical protein
MVEALIDDQVGRGKGAVDVAHAATDDDGGVVGPVLVDTIVAASGRPERHDGEERVVVDGDAVHRVRQPIRVVRDDDRYRLAHVPDHLRREDALHVGPGAGGAAEGRRDSRRDLREIGGGVDGDPGHRAGGIRGDPSNPRVRVKASHHAEVRRPGPPEIVQVAAAALEEGRVLLPAGGGADRAGAHAAGPGR